jgi:FkbM family methyltransferase
VVLDIGANVGHFSAACRNLGFDVVAVEPHPAALRHLKKRFRHDSKVTILEKAVSDHAKLVTLHMHPQHVFDPISTSIAASIFPDKFITDTLQVEVESLTMTMLFEKHGSFEIVKIDIEGAEMLLVDDIINNHARINKLLMETHERFL